MSGVMLGIPISSDLMLFKHLSAIEQAFTIKTVNYTLALTDFSPIKTIVANSAANLVFTLPYINRTAYVSRVLRIEKWGTGTLTIQPHDLTTIHDGGLGFLISCSDSGFSRINLEITSVILGFPSFQYYAQMMISGGVGNWTTTS